MKKGCIEIVEGTRCEDHWICGCRCVQCVHLNASRKSKMEKQKQKQTTTRTITEEEEEEENEIMVSKQKKI